MAILRTHPFAWSLLMGASLLSAQDPADGIRFARFPHSHGDQLAFTYHGDIWVSGLDGSQPRRLTAHVANDRSPRFSPDGKHIAFTSDRMGNDDVWVVPVAGGAPQQLTFHSTGDRVQYWMPDGERILFSTTRGSKAWGSPLHTVGLNGNLPLPLEMDKASAGMVSPDGQKIAFNRNGMRYWRKGYRGNNNTDVWVQDVGGGAVRQLTDLELQQYQQHVQDAYPMWGADGRIYYLSERGGETFEIWRIDADGGAPEQVTRHGGDGVQFPAVSPDGKTLTYESDFRLWRLAIPDGEPQEIVVAMEFDPKVNQVGYKTSDSQAEGFTPSPDGRYVAVDHHGEIFVVPTDPEVGEMRQVTNSGWRDRYQHWSPDGAHIAFVSDASGEEQIWVWNRETGEQRKLTSHESQKGAFHWSPDSKQIAFVAANRLHLVDVAAGTTKELAYNSEGGFSMDGFSADGEWLVYTRRDEDLNSEVYLFEIASGRELNVTDDPHRDGNGVLTADGEHLLFESDRSGTMQVYKVSLARLSENPDDPMVRERQALAKESKKDKKKDGDEEGADQASDISAALQIDLDGIADRAMALTSGSGARSPMLSKDGKTVYYLGSDDDGSGLFSIPLAGGESKRVAKGRFRGLVMAGDGKSVFYLDGGGVQHMPLSSKKAKKIAFDFTVRVDRRAEWRQIFEESYRVMKYRFYDENMHGVDWPAMRSKYLPMLGSAGSTEDVYDICNEMIGELNASHTGVRGPSDIDAPDTYRTRFLGVELEPADGALRVSHVYRDGPADKEWLDIDVGDFVLAIDGHRVGANTNYWRILNHALNDFVAIEVADTPDGEARSQRIETVTSLRNIQYEEWVAERRDIVEKVGGGDVAYVHIRSMNRPSLARFEKEIDRFWNAKAIVVDIRYNGGGNIDQQLLDILERRPYEYWNNRWSGRGWGRRPRQAIAGPKVMLINSRSGSDSEVTPQGFRDLGLGTIVGNPTYGAVIATGSYRLINGGSIRTPGSLVVTYDPTKPNNYGINLENYGVPPDLWVENTPADELEGYDRELETATKEALRMLSEGQWQYRDGR